MLTIYMKVLVESRLGREFVIVAPFLDNAGKWWEVKGSAVLNQLTAHYLPPEADRERLFLLGLSNGASGALAAAIDRDLSWRFAGFILLSGLFHLPAEFRVDAPVLVVHGKEDKRFEPEYIDTGVSLLRRAGAEVVREALDSNHFLILSRKEELGELVAAWARGIQ